MVLNDSFKIVDQETLTGVKAAEERKNRGPPIYQNQGTPLAPLPPQHVNVTAHGIYLHSLGTLSRVR